MLTTLLSCVVKVFQSVLFFNIISSAANNERQEYKLNHIIYSSGSSIKKLVTENISENRMLCEEWVISIDLKFNKLTTAWKNIFSLQVKGRTNFTAGSRIPAVWVRSVPSKLDYVMLMIANNINANPNYLYNIIVESNANKWTNLKINQINKIYEIKVDNKPVHRVVNLNPRKWRNVDLTIGNTYGTGNISDIGEYRNFEINTCSKRKIIIFEAPHFLNFYFL